MSADNGIYILKTKDQYRVIHAQAIENIYWEHGNRDAYYYNKRHERYVPTRVVEYWGNCKYTRSGKVAQQIAETMLKEIGFVEYGIHTFTYNKTWKHIVEDARKMAKVEIRYLSRYCCDEYEIKKLQNILNMEV